MNGVTLYKEDAGFFTKLAAFLLMPQSGHLYFLNQCRFLGKYGKSPAKTSTLIGSCQESHIEGRWGFSCYVC